MNIILACSPRGFLLTVSYKPKITVTHQQFFWTERQKS